MDRRQFIGVLGSATVAWPCGGRAQTAAKVPRVGFLRVGAPPPSFIGPLRTGLKSLGWIDGENLVFDFGIATQVAELPGLAAELVRRPVDVLVASGTPAGLPARNATTAIPIVFVAALDPVATGVVASYARPGGNVTGLTAVFSDLTAKRLELLKELMPSLKRAALLSRPANPAHQEYVQQTLMAARILRVELEIMAVNSADEFEAAVGRVSGVEALIQIDDAMFTSHRDRLLELAARHRIAGAYGFRDFVDAGGFVALGPSYAELYRRAASYIDKILKGAKAADLPVEQASKFEFILNLRTAKVLGLDIPPTLLARADEVIE